MTRGGRGAPSREHPRRLPRRRGRRRHRPVRRHHGARPTSPSPSRPAPSTRSSAPTAPASRRCSTSSPASTRPRTGRCGSATPARPDAPAPDRRHRRGPDLPEHRAVAARQSVAENLMLGRHHLTQAGLRRRRPAAAAGHPRGQAAPRAGRARSPSSSSSATSCDTPVGLLSYGDQKRVEVARALCLEPRLLLLDEPVAGMNAEETARMAEAILDDPVGAGHLRSSSSSTTWAWSWASPTGSRCSTSADASPTAPPPRCSADPEVIRAYLGTGRRGGPTDRGRRPPVRQPHRDPGEDPVTHFLSLLLNGISLGAIYALIALGLRDHLQGQRGRQLHAGLAAAAGRVHRRPAVPDPLGFSLGGARRRSPCTALVGAASSSG